MKTTKMLMPAVALAVVAMAAASCAKDKDAYKTHPEVGSYVYFDCCDVLHTARECIIEDLPRKQEHRGHRINEVTIVRLSNLVSGNYYYYCAKCNDASTVDEIKRRVERNIRR